jgi:hypothetical protein
MSPSEAFEKLKTWQESTTRVKLIHKQKHPAPEAKGREMIEGLDVTIELLEGERLRLSYNGETEELDLAGATLREIDYAK